MPLLDKDEAEEQRRNRQNRPPSAAELAFAERVMQDAAKSLALIDSASQRSLNLLMDSLNADADALSENFRKIALDGISAIQPKIDLPMYLPAPRERGVPLADYRAMVEAETRQRVRAERAERQNEALRRELFYRNANGDSAEGPEPRFGIHPHEPMDPDGPSLN